MKTFNPENLLHITSINTSRQGLCYYEEEDTARILNTGTLTFVENRKFKIDIENKFKACRANQSYVFPLRVNGSFDEEDRELCVELAKARFYNLHEQNEQPTMKHRRSRSQSSMRLFHKVLQQEKSDLSKKKEAQQKRNNGRDKENLNFQNLLTKMKDKQNVSCNEVRGTCKPCPQPKNMAVTASNSHISNRTCIPKLNLQSRDIVQIDNSPRMKSPNIKTSSIKCFRDLLKVDASRR